jgi:hypothetical protein
LPDLLPLPATIVTSVAARSVNTPSRFLVSVNSQSLQQIDISPISTALYDLFGHQVQKADNFILTQNSAALSFQYVPGSFNSQGWLNWFEFFGRRGK